MTDPTGAHTKAKHNEAQIIDRKNTTTPNSIQSLWLFEGNAVLKSVNICL